MKKTMLIHAGRIIGLLAALGGGCAGQADPAELAARVAEIRDELVQVRRDLHRHPELSNREFETSRRVAEYLKACGLAPRAGVAGTGVVALIEGAHPGPCVMLRADMDALPVVEQTGLPFASANEGVMHACGHDVHMTVQLGAAKVLGQLRDRLHGSVKLVFQPAEEGPPAGEEGGAALMIKEGVLQDPPVAAAYALHVSPRYEAGVVALRAGADMACADTFEIVVEGRRSHGAWPHLGVDPIPVAAQIILELQTMVSRSQDATSPVVLTVGQIQGGNRFNILAGEVRMGGTLRTLDPRQREELHGRMEKIVRANCEPAGAEGTFTIRQAAPLLWNDPTETRRARAVLERNLGPERVVESRPKMVAEDFGAFSEKIPVVHFHLGIRNERLGCTHPLHSDRFNCDEAAIPAGVQAMCALVLDYLQPSRGERGQPAPGELSVERPALPAPAEAAEPPAGSIPQNEPGRAPAPMTTPGPAAAPAEGFRLKVDTRLVTLNVQVGDAVGANLAGLRQEAFHVFDNGTEQPLAYFEPQSAPLNLLLLLDLSGSTKEKTGLIKRAASRFVEMLNPADRVAVAAFTSRYMQVSGFTEDRALLRERIGKIKNRGGGTAFYEAMWYALDEFAEAPGRRNIIVVMSDGVDNVLQYPKEYTSKWPFEEVLGRVSTSDVTVFPVYLDTEYEQVVEEGNTSSITYRTARKQITALADGSGGTMFTVRRYEDLEGVYRLVASELRNLYTLSYYAPAKAGGGREWHEVNVKVDPAGARARTRPGYFLE